MKIKIAVTVALLALSACKSDGEKTEPEATAEQPAETTGSTQGAVEQPTSAPADDAPETSFWSAALTADKLVITDMPANPNPALGGKPVEVTDAAWLKKFHDAIGDGPGAEAVPRCLPTYFLTYYKGDTEVAKYSAVCANATEAMFVRNGQSFAAQDDATVMAMFAEFAKPAE